MLTYAAGIAMTRRFWHALAALECVRAASLDEEAEEHASRHRFSPMLTYAHVCSRMLTYAIGGRGAREQTQALTYAHVCSRMLTYAHVR